VTNANRQLHAVRGTTGKPKTTVMAERLRQINPALRRHAPRPTFYSSRDQRRRCSPASPTSSIDAIDNLAAKTHLIATCRAQGIPLVVSGGASGRMDPTQIRVADLNSVVHDPFLAATRKLLRRNHDFPHRDKEAWGIPTMHSQEAAHRPGQELHYDNGEGFKLRVPAGRASSLARLHAP
jgi:tRNA A37 threonylcarbamoyladenosine dehydratase